MRNALRVWLRDIKRLFWAPAAITVVLFLVVLPSLYTWFNVWGFWDPYAHTQNLRVCVVNQDVPATSELTGTLDLGSQVVDALRQNDELGWEFTDYDTAMDEVNRGYAYAAFVIPEDFSTDVVALFGGGDIEHPHLQYYVNEKAGAVSPKITDAGSTQLDETINATFVSTVTSTVADLVDQKASELTASLRSTQSQLTADLDDGAAALGDTRTALQNLQTQIGDARSATADAKGSLGDARNDIALASDSLSRVASLSSLVQTDTLSFTSKLAPALSASSIALSSAVVDANKAVGDVADNIRAQQGRVKAAYESAEGVLQASESAAKSLREMEAQVSDESLKQQIDAAATDLENQNKLLADALGQVGPVVEDPHYADELVAKSDALGNAALSAISTADGLSTSLNDQTLPQVNNGVTQLVNAADGVSSAIAAQSALVDQTAVVLDQLDSTLASAYDAVGKTDGLVASVQDGLSTARTDLSALTSSETYSALVSGGHIDAQRVAEFMASPTEVVTESLYPVNAYGSSMAPLFTNLTLWIGVFMLMVILRQDVDDEGIPDLTIRQRYVGRFLFLLPLVALQAAVCITGNLLIGVQSESVALYYLTAIVASVAYLCIQYTLSVTMQHIGKGLCVIMVFAQIPGATGLYPIEMTPSFFRTVYPLMPFTYGINAMRETIAGFYDGVWAQLMLVLVGFAVVSFAIGLAATPLLANLNRMFAKQISATDIFNGGDVHLPARRYRLSQLVSMLSSREWFQEHLQKRSARFFHYYPKLKRGAAFVGVVVPAVMAACSVVFNFDRVVLLTMWLLWVIAIVLFLVVLEKLCDSIEEQMSLKDMSDDELRVLYASRNSYQDLDAPASDGEDAESAHGAGEGA